MAGPQFVHVQTYARKANPAGQCIAQVLGEAARQPEFSAHVDLPQLPEVVVGMSLPELRAAHDVMVAAASTAVRINGKVRQRAIRQDRHTLLAAVTSYPLTWHQIGPYPYAQARLAEWEAATVTWAREHFGAHFASAIRRRDEPYPHLHIYALPIGLKGVDAVLLHVGKRAKRETLERLKADGVSAKEAARAANIFYKQAMRELQDEYYRAVGEPCGLTRMGPRRRRLSNAAWHAEKREAELRRERLDKLEFREAHADARDEAQNMRERDQDARDRVQKARIEALALVVSLIAGGRLRVAQGRVQVPLKHHPQLRLIWPDIAPAMVELMTLRDRWSGGLAQLLDLLRRGKVPASLRDKAMQILKEQARL